MKRVLIITVVIALLSVFLPMTVIGQETLPDLLVDNADILTDEEETKLEAKLEKLVKEHKMHFVIVTVADLNGESLDYYADSYYHDNGYGYGNEKSGILLLLAMDLSECGIYTYGDATAEFSDIRDLEDEILSEFRKDEFYNGFVAYADTCDDILSFDVFGSLIVAIVVGAIISLIIVFSMKSKLKSVRPQKTASNYVRAGSFMLTKDLDLYLYRTVTRTRRADNNSGSRSSGGGSRSGSYRGGGKF